MTSTAVDPTLTAGNRKPLAAYQATHFGWHCDTGVATITLNRPERKNPLTFASYAELRDLFAALKYAPDVHVVVLVGARGLRLPAMRVGSTAVEDMGGLFFGRGCGVGLCHLVHPQRAELRVHLA